MGLMSGPARRIEGDGTPTSAWRDWPGLAALAPLDIDTLVPPGARAVLVAPHPDDELLACGGLLQLLLARATPVLLVAVTDGGASHPRSTVWPPERLLDERPRETARALGQLGLATLPVQLLRAHLPDGAVAAHAAELQTLLEQTLGPDDVVFVTWRLDGHPDHEAAGHASAAAATTCHARLVEVPVWTWHWASPGDPRVPWQRAHRLPLSGEQLQRKRSAIACYQSQLQPDPSTGQPAILPPATLDRLLDRDEIYFL